MCCVNTPALRRYVTAWKRYRCGAMYQKTVVATSRAPRAVACPDIVLPLFRVRLMSIASEDVDAHAIPNSVDA